MLKLPEPIQRAIESGRVPSPPQLLVRLMHGLDDDQSTMATLARLVEQDAGLAARVLTAANSPILRRGTELHSLENCLLALGTRLVRSITTCLSIQSLFDRRAKVPAANLTAFWGHSLLVAETARSLAVATGYEQPEEAYLAGLLHDIGELLLLTGLGPAYAKLLAHCPDEAALQAKELGKLDTDHGEVGAWLADQWELDSGFADAILFHHAPPELIVTAAPFPQLIWLAHQLVAAEDISTLPAGIDATLFGQLGVDQLAELRQQAEQRTRQIGEALGMSLPAALSGKGIWNDLPAPNWDEDEALAADEELSALIGGFALLQPLQQDLFELENEAEIILSLRESARILFDISRLAFLLDDGKGKLSGARVGGQPALFSQVSIAREAQRCMAASSARQHEILSSYPVAADEQERSLIDLQFARALGSEGILCIPMLSRNRTYGVMICGLSANQYARLSRRLPWLLNFGRIAAISLETLNEARAFRQKARDDASTHFNRQARRVIHEARNPLGIIKSYLKILDRKLPAETEIRQELEILTEEIDRVAEIVGKMSEIPSEAPAGEGLNVCDLLRELMLLYGEPLFNAKGLRVDLALPNHAQNVTCTRDSLKQIVLNLWKNASEALSEGQQIKITLTDNVVHNGVFYIQLRMDDNGPGMSDEAMRSIHRPRDAQPAGNRGLGLSIVGELARQQSIPITCRSQIGQGTSIALLLPKHLADSTESTSENTGTTLR